MTLAFPAPREELFQEKYFHDSLTQFRWSFFLVTVIYEAFGFLDSRIDPQDTPLFHWVRYGIVLPGLSSVLLLSFSKYFQKIWQPAIFCGILVAGFAGVVLTLKAADNYAYYAGMMIIFSAGYFFLKLRFFYATLAGWLILLFFNIAALTFARIGSEMLLINDFFFVATNLIGMFAAYNIELYTRRDFFLNQQLDERNAEIVEANRNLESKVVERTAELILARDRAEESDRLKSAFLANMSHEIRTPMNGILGFAGLLKEPNLTGEEQQSYLDIIEKSGVRMLNTINDIVDISKIEAGQVEILVSATNINEQVEYLYSFFRPEAEKKGLKFSFSNGLENHKAIFNTDREKLYAILTNLVKNALKYTDSGSIEFGYRIIHPTELNHPPVQAELEFFVKDTGIGIPADRREAIFERFVQADIEDSRAMQGSGLGLAISRAYVEMMGGKIRVESMEGAGSAFYFNIPCTTAGQIARPEKTDFSGDAEMAVGRKLKIIIAEDDEISCNYLATEVKKYGDEIIVVKTGAEAVEACRIHPDTHLLMMDLRMPVMDGYEATRQIRQFNSHTVILAQSAYAFVDDRQRAIDAGCNDYISKPVMAEPLRHLIHKHFSGK